MPAKSMLYGPSLEVNIDNLLINCGLLLEEQVIRFFERVELVQRHGGRKWIRNVIDWMVKAHKIVNVGDCLVSTNFRALSRQTSDYNQVKRQMVFWVIANMGCDNVLALHCLDDASQFFVNVKSGELTDDGEEEVLAIVLACIQLPQDIAAFERIKQSSFLKFEPDDPADLPLYIAVGANNSLVESCQESRFDMFCLLEAPDFKPYYCQLGEEDV